MKKGLSIITLAASLMMGVSAISSTNANAKAKYGSSYWNQARYVKVKSSVAAKEYKVTQKNKKLNLTKKVIKKAHIKSGTELTARSMGNGMWQVISQKYPSSNKGVWIVQEKNTKWFKLTKAPKTTNTYKTVASEYSRVSSDSISTDANKPSVAYAPFGFKPITLTSGVTIDAGHEYRVYSDTSKNEWVVTVNGKNYSLPKQNNYTFTTANSQYAPNSNNANINSLYAPNDAHALVPSGYSPQNGRLWVQYNSDGSIKQYYFYTNQSKSNTGWVKAKVQTQNGKSTIVPE